MIRRIELTQEEKDAATAPGPQADLRKRIVERTGCRAIDALAALRAYDRELRGLPDTVVYEKEP